jgi:membrane carboxypeptidase/penicillin-binding protein
MQKALADAEPEDFPVPENVVAMPVNHQTGRPVPPGSADAIMEYFRKGAEPKDTHPISPVGAPQAAEAPATPMDSPPPVPPPAAPDSLPAETSLALPRGSER